MRNDKKLAIQSRKLGKSYNQINKELEIPKSTLSCWLKNIKLSKKAKEKIESRTYNKSTKLLIERNKAQTVIAKQRGDEIRKRAKLETNDLMKNKLFISGISLYWAEGYKKGAYGSKWKCVDFANSDPEMIHIMMNFFKKICGIERSRIKIQLIAHPNINIKQAVNFWSKLTQVPEKQFIKTYCSVNKNNKNKRQTNSLIYGTVHIRICDVKLFFKIIGWIDGLKLNLKS